VILSNIPTSPSIQQKYDKSLHGTTLLTTSVKHVPSSMVAPVALPALASPERPQDETRMSTGAARLTIAA
jgi:hypothetical protein